MVYIGYPVAIQTTDRFRKVRVVVSSEGIVYSVGIVPPDFVWELTEDSILDSYSYEQVIEVEAVVKLDLTIVEDLLNQPKLVSLQNEPHFLVMRGLFEDQGYSEGVLVKSCEKALWTIVQDLGLKPIFVSKKVISCKNWRSEERSHCCRWHISGDCRNMVSLLRNCCWNYLRI